MISYDFLPKVVISDSRRKQDAGLSRRIVQAPQGATPIFSIRITVVYHYWSRLGVNQRLSVISRYCPPDSPFVYACNLLQAQVKFFVCCDDDKTNDQIVIRHCS